MDAEQKKELELLRAERSAARFRNTLGVAGVFGLFFLLLLNQDSDKLPYLFLLAIVVFCLVVFGIYVHLTIKHRRRRVGHPKRKNNSH